MLTDQVVDVGLAEGVKEGKDQTKQHPHLSRVAKAFFPDIFLFYTYFSRSFFILRRVFLRKLFYRSTVVRLPLQPTTPH